MDRLDTIAGMFKGDEIGDTIREGVRDIIRLRKIVDNLTVRLNAEITKTYGLDAALTKLEIAVAGLDERLKKRLNL